MDLIEAALAEFERGVRQLPADSWDWPTPSEVSLRDLIEHVPCRKPKDLQDVPQALGVLDVPLNAGALAPAGQRR